MPSKSLAWRLVCLLGFASTICLSGRGQVWDFLGDAQIDGTRDHDRIQVTRRDGVFHTIQLRVSGDPIFLDRVVVHFEMERRRNWPLATVSGQEEETASWASPASLIQSKASSFGITGSLGTTAPG